MHEKTVGAKLPSVMALAYLGDARHSLYVRRMLVGEGISKSGELNRRSLEYVTAKAQAEMFRKIEPQLTEDELAVARRASNSQHLNKPKRASVADYRHATAFEAVIGMLTWLCDEDRIEELLALAAKD
ncbi:MAG: ribonuclease III [Clostridia bacterium]|nr:ribonuclease III [Clostridia bacterium]